MTTNNISHVETPEHPGVILRGLLDSVGMSQKELSAAIGKTTPVINDILSGKRDINVEIALLLEAVFDQISAKQWLEIQTSFDLAKVSTSPKLVERQQSIKAWKDLGTVVNLNILKKRAGLGNSVEDDVQFLFDLYGVSSIQLLKDRINSTKKTAYFKKSSVLQVDDVNLHTWLLLTRIASRKKTLQNSFESKNINKLIKALNLIFYTNDRTLEQVGSTLSDYGIKFIVEEKLDKVPVDGYSFWIENNPTIVVTKRYKWLDNVAFTIFHELGHIVAHLTSNRTADFLDADSTSSTDSKEVEANEFAEKAIWGDTDYKAIFRTISQPFAAAPYITHLSNRLQINEGIIVGQYQHYCFVQGLPAAYAVCQKQRQKIK